LAIAMTVDLRKIIEDTQLKFNRPRAGPQPTINAQIPPHFDQLFWHDESLERFLKFFVYYALHSSDPDTPVDVVVHARTKLADLEDFVGLTPVYWIQFRIRWHGSPLTSGVIGEMFSDLGYRCQDWINAKRIDWQLSVFIPARGDAPKLIFCVAARESLWECDFLLPISRLVLPFNADLRKK